MWVLLELGLLELELVGIAGEDDDDGWVMRLYPHLVDDKVGLYLRSFYFVFTTMTTVGYGDASPSTGSPS